MPEAINEPALTLTLCVAASNAKWQAGEVVEALRVGSARNRPAPKAIHEGQCDYRLPVDAGAGLRGSNRLALGIDGWRDDLDRAAEMAISIDVTSHSPASCSSTAMPSTTQRFCRARQAMAETAEALMLAERCGDDFALDSARLARGNVLGNTVMRPSDPSGWNCWPCIVRRR